MARKGRREVKEQLQLWAVEFADQADEAERRAAKGGGTIIGTDVMAFDAECPLGKCTDPALWSSESGRALPVETRLAGLYAGAF